MPLQGKFRHSGRGCKVNATMTTSNALLASLAIIKANWDYSQESYVDNFLPFFLDAVKSAEGPMSALAAQVHIRERFGIDIPHGVLNTLSRRAVHKNYGRRENGSFIADQTKLADVRDLGRQKADYLRKQSALVNELVKYSADRFQRTLTIEDAEDALLNHIEEHSVPILGSVMNGAPYDARSALRSSRDTEYVVNSFISEVVSSMPASFDHLETVVKGSMLAVSLYLPNNSELGKRFDRTSLYLDTPVLLKALGYEGHEAKAAANDLLALSRSAGAELACFEHSVSEVRGILDRSAGKALHGGVAISRTWPGSTRPRGQAQAGSWSIRFVAAVINRAASSAAISLPLSRCTWAMNARSSCSALAMLFGDVPVM